MRRGACGFSLVEMLMAFAVLATVAAVAVPTINDGMRRQRLDSAARQVAMQVGQARLQAVSANRRMRVRLNCPAPNMYRVVEVTGNSTIDTAGNRCQQAAYPYPDPNPAARPNLDGPVMLTQQGTRFGTVQEVEISPRGTVTALSGALPAVIQVTDGAQTRSVRITAAGQLRIQ